MDLKYRILWFDDQPGLVDGAAAYVKAKLDALGFDLNITWIDCFDDTTINPLIATLRAYSPFDLILVDYDLGVKVKGDALLKKLRNNTNGEMIFYSAVKVKALRELLVGQGVDGIYCLPRDQRLGSEIYSIVDSTLRRFFHPNYMRGLVVGSVSELESKFAEMIIKLLSLSNMPPDDEIRETIVIGARKHLEAEMARLNAVDKIPLARLINKANLHAKMEILLSLLERNGSRIAQSSLNVLSKFMDEINAPRIEFAHAKTVELNGLPVFKERQGKIWNTTEMKSLLRKIRDHKNAASIISDISDV